MVISGGYFLSVCLQAVIKGRSKHKTDFAVCVGSGSCNHVIFEKSIAQWEWEKIGFRIIRIP